MRLRRFDMRPRLAADRRRMETAHANALTQIAAHLARRRRAWEQLSTKLAQLSPLRILERGYAIVSSEGRILKDVADAPPGQQIHVRLAKGDLDATVR
jgi:exodeoxyribonuclease VII large subunit